MNVERMPENEKGKKELKNQGRLGKLKDQMYSRAAQPAQRPRRSLSGIETTISDDWKEEEEHESIESKEENLLQQPPKKRYSYATIILAVAVLVFVVAGGIAATFLLSGSNVITSRKIDITVNGPRTIDGGDVLELQVAVTNKNSATLELADLVITYPAGTRKPSDPSILMESQRIPLGTIKSGETRNGTVRGIVFGTEGEREEITVTLEYRLSGSSALFSTETKHTVLVASGSLDIALKTNSQAVAGQVIDMTATITSRAKTRVSGVVLKVSYPFGFTPTNTSPEIGANGLWNLGDLEPGATRDIRIVGVLDGQSGDTRVFKFTAGTQADATSNDVDIPLATFDQAIAVERPFLGMTLSYDKLSADDYIAHTGEIVPIKVTWQNNLSVALTDVVIAATLSGSGLDPFSISADRGFFRSIDSVVLWDKTTTEGELSSVPAGASGEYIIRLTPKAAQNLVGVENPSIKIELHAAGQRLAESNVPQTIQATVSDEIKIATDAKLSGKAMYFDNPLGSVGPLPPKVEFETTYGILWELSNTSNLIKNGKVTAVLPSYMRWLGTVSPSAENVTFNENDGTITWNVGNVLSETGTGGKAPRRVIFSIGLVPSASQVKTAPMLIQNQVFKGVDTFTGKEVSSAIDGIDTKLDEAEFSEDYGEIVQ